MGTHPSKSKAAELIRRREIFVCVAGGGGVGGIKKKYVPSQSKSYTLALTFPGKCWNHEFCWSLHTPGESYSFLSEFVKKITPAHTFFWSGENEGHLPEAQKENSGCRRREPEPGLKMRARKEGRQTPSWTKLGKSCRRWWDSNPNGPQVNQG